MAIMATSDSIPVGGAAATRVIPWDGRFQPRLVRNVMIAAVTAFWDRVKVWLGEERGEKFQKRVELFKAKYAVVVTHGGKQIIGRT